MFEFSKKLSLKQLLRYSQIPSFAPIPPQLPSFASSVLYRPHKKSLPKGAPALLLIKQRQTVYRGILAWSLISAQTVCKLMRNDINDFVSSAKWQTIVNPLIMAERVRAVALQTSTSPPASLLPLRHVDGALLRGGGALRRQWFLVRRGLGLGTLNS